jgi:hypothetical protein
VSDLLSPSNFVSHDHWTDLGWGKKGYTHAHYGGGKPHDHDSPVGSASVGGGGQGESLDGTGPQGAMPEAPAPRAPLPTDDVSADAFRKRVADLVESIMPPNNALCPDCGEPYEEDKANSGHTLDCDLWKLAGELYGATDRAEHG